MRLFGKFVSGEMISLAVSGGGGAVGVSRKIMEFRGSIVHTLWHLVLLDNLDAAKVEAGQDLSIVDVLKVRAKKLRDLFNKSELGSRNEHVDLSNMTTRIAQ